MLSLTMTALALVAAYPDPDVVEIFAKEGFYKSTKGPEVEFVGVLKKTPRKDGVIGFGRVNPFRLDMAGGKVREVYIGAKGKVLDPFVGKRVKFVGKAVDMEVEGRQHHEIWPASLVVLQGEKKAGKSDGPKIHARSAARIATTTTVIKSADQLGKLRNMDGDKATAAVAKLLNVKTIDWDKQMLIVISGGLQRTGGYSVEAKSLEVKDRQLIVHWMLKTPPKNAIVIQVLTTPTLTILVDRFDGAVVFDPKSPPAGKGKKLGR